ncbi:hypothetical protein GCM10025867_22940 [Frondihabitans sucicola]|uniref:Uncharacterized protein n=1 Tax=Frondihabitans sucicola TaxID=1268041 RepID=A0ABM8GNR4_9MICO|nr:hypothetical protein GCM10025867_22940 [Frondihabitans sucicola]
MPADPGDRRRLLPAELGQRCSGHPGVELPEDVRRSLTVAEEQQAHQSFLAF